MKIKVYDNKKGQRIEIELNDEELYELTSLGTTTKVIHHEKTGTALKVTITQETWEEGD